MKKFNVSSFGWLAMTFFMCLGSVVFAHVTHLQNADELEMGPFKFNGVGLEALVLSGSAEQKSIINLNDIPGYNDPDPFGMEKKNPSGCNHGTQACNHDHGHEASWGLEFAAEAPAMMTQNETLPAGTWIIAMDNALQDNSSTRVRQAYGLAVHLLHGGVPLKWIIDPNKTNRTDIDFSASARQRFPTTGSYGTRDFRTGPIAIFPGYETEAQSIINSFGNGIRVYELENATTVPVNMDLTHKPFVFVEQDQNPDIHTGILSDAGLVEFTHYEEGDLTTITGSSCVTIITVPHNSSISTSQRNSVKDFARSGGNFFAQCAGVRGFQENTPRVFTNAGFVDEPGLGSFLYDNPQEPSAQFEGNIPDEGGSLENFAFVTDPPGGTRIVHDSGNDFKAYTGRIDGHTGESGGYVHYLGGHDYKGDIDADRYYLNAVLRSADRPDGCGLEIELVVANDDSGQIDCGNNEVVVDVLQNDENPNGDPLNMTVTLIGSGSNGTFTVISQSGRDQIRYVGNVNGLWAGDEITYEACDGSECDQAVLTITGPNPSENTISGTVFEDPNTNGNQDSGESGPSGITVELFESGGVTPIQTTTTAAGGGYQFTVTPPVTCTDETLFTNGDSFTAEEDPSNNFGGCNEVGISTYSGSFDAYSYAQFDLSGIDNACTVASAELIFTHTSSNTCWGEGGSSTPFNFEARRVTSSWTEGGITWNNQPGNTGSYGTQSGSRSDAAGTNYTFDVTTLVQDWLNGTPNNGVVLVPTTTTDGWFSFVSREDNPSQSPRLIITYGPSAGANDYDIRVDASTLPPASTFTTDNIETANFTGNGQLDCNNDFGFLSDDQPVANDDSATTDEDTPVNIAVLTNDDFGNDGPSTGTITLLTQPANGTATVNDGGTPNDPTDDTVDYTPDPNFNGTDNFDYEICDADGDCDPATVTVTVNSVNDLPIANDDSATTDEDTPVNIAVLTNDDFGGDGPSTGTITLLTQPANGTATVNDGGTPNDPTDDTVDYTPDADFNGTDNFNYEICDANGDCDPATVTVTVNSVNDLPVANDDSATTDEDTPVNIAVLTNDDFGGDGPSTGTITLLTQPSNGTATVNDGGTPNDPTDDTVDYTPDADFNGTDNFDYEICDADGDCDPATVTVTINSVDDQPVANDDSATTNEDTPVNIAVLTNDDFGGDGPSTGTITLLTQPSNGTATVNDGGTPNDPTDDTVDYTPDADFNGTDNFDYEICDADGDCDPATVTVTINSVDDQPVAEDDSATTDEDTAVNIAVLTNDDFGGDGPSTGTITLLTQPANGTATVNDGGTPNDPTDDTVDYTPDADFNGTDNFDYEICDADGDCDPATVTVTINSVDDQPIAEDDSATTNEDTPVNIAVLTNDDFGGDGPSTGTITLLTQPSNGTATVNDGGTPNDPTDDTVDYTPDADFNGTDNYDYEICDADGDCDPATVTVTINSVDDQPIAEDDSATTNQDTPVNIAVLTNDDFGGDGPSTGTITLLTQPANGTATVNDGGTPNDPTDDTVDYTPDNGFSGADNFDYEICDADGDCDPATVNVTVNFVNDFPTANDDSGSACEAVSEEFSVVDNDDFGNDGPGSSPISIVSGPSNGSASVNDNGTPGNPTDDLISYTSNNDFSGSDQLTYEICDGNGDCDQAILTITVEDRLSPGTNGSTQICEGETVTTTELFNSLGGTPDAGGTWSPTPAGAGTYTYTHAATANCPASSAQVEVTEQPAPDAGTNGSTQICEGETVTTTELFNSLGGTPDAGGTWSPTPAGAGTYTYTVSGSPDCPDATAQVEVTEQPAPDAGTNGSTQICEGETVTTTELFNSLGGTPDAGGTWSPTPAGAGTYTYTVSGTPDCPDATAKVEVTEQPAPDAGTNGSTQICEGETVTTTELFNSLGGTPDAGGTWSPTPAGAGTYTYTVSGAPDCPDATAQVEVTEQPAPNAGTNGSTQICEGETVTTTELFNSLGGTPDAGGTWSPTPAGAGTYTYTVSGAPDCPDATAQVEVTEQPEPDAGTNGNLTICEGETVTATDLFNALGGTPDAGGTWSPTPAGAGAYTYTVSGAPDCPDATAQVEVTEEPVPNITVTPTNPTDCEVSDGRIIVEVTGTSLDVQYSIDGGLSFSDNGIFIGLDPGTYEVEVMYGDCTEEFGEVTLTGPSNPTITNVSLDNPDDCDSPTGSITITSSTPVIDTEYSIDGGQTWQASNIFNGLIAGFYETYVRNADGTCPTAGPVVVLNEPDDPVLLLVEITDPTGCDGNDGTIKAVGSGGEPPYQFRVEKPDGSFLGWTATGTEFTFTGLEAGDYDVQIRNSDGTCEIEPLTVQLDDVDQPTIVGAQTTRSACQAGGTATLFVDGGEVLDDYQYSTDALNWTPGGDSYTFTDLAPGAQTLWVANDDLSCPVSIDLTIQSECLELEKTSELTDTNGDGFIGEGDVISFSFVVTNTGDVTITSVNITDPQLPILSGFAGTLDSGESYSGATAEHTVTAADVGAGEYVNQATASGQNPENIQVDDLSDDPNDPTDNDLEGDGEPDDPTVTPIPFNPAIELLKEGTFEDENGDGFAQVGESVSYTFTVTNSGNVTLTDVTVSDPLVNVQGGPIASLGPDESDNSTFTASYVLTQMDIDEGKVLNQATTSGDDPNGDPVTDDSEDPTPITPPSDPNCPDCTETELPQNPVIELKKVGTLDDGGNGVDVGDVIDYDFTVTNSGNTTLYNVVLTDTDLTTGPTALSNLTDEDGDGSTDDLAVGVTASATGTYTLTQTDIDAGEYMNTADVEGDDPNEDPVTDSDTDTQTISRTAELTVKKNETSRSFVVGEFINYEIIVTNTGNVTVDNIDVTDDNAIILTGNPVGTLAPGASSTLTAQHEVVQADVDAGFVANTAIATGDSPTGTDDVTDVSDTGTDSNGDAITDNESVETPDDLDPGSTDGNSTNDPTVTPIDPPDVTPVITASPNIMNGPTIFNLYVEVTELNEVNTDGTITVRIPKDTRWSFAESYDPTLTELGGTSLDNADWSYSEETNNHVFTSTETILGGDFSTFGFEASWDAGATRGVYTITSQIEEGSGGENRIDNNVDAERIDYFID